MLLVGDLDGVGVVVALTNDENVDVLEVDLDAVAVLLAERETVLESVDSRDMVAVADEASWETVSLPDRVVDSVLVRDAVMEPDREGEPDRVLVISCDTLLVVDLDAVCVGVLVLENDCAAVSDRDEEPVRESVATADTLAVSDTENDAVLDVLPDRLPDRDILSA